MSTETRHAASLTPLEDRWQEFRSSCLRLIQEDPRAAEQARDLFFAGAIAMHSVLMHGCKASEAIGELTWEMAEQEIGEFCILWKQRRSRTRPEG